MAESRRDLPVPVRVSIRRPGGQESVEYAVNLSAGGACLQLREPLEPGAKILLRFELPPDGSLVDARARVVWTTREEERGDQRFSETGIQFEELDPPARERLERFATQAGDPRR